MSTDLITTLVLAAGASSRYADGGVPKQFRHVTHDGPPRQMWECAVHGLHEARLHVAVRTEHARHLKPVERTAAQVVEVPSTTGQADTLRQALTIMCETFSGVQASRDLLVVNCDNGFEHGELDAMVDAARVADDVVVVAAERMQSPTDEQFARFSWAMPARWFTVALEKTAPPVPPHDGFHRALVGAYYFPSIPVLRQALALWCGGVAEPFISGVLNILPGRKRCHEVQMWHDWGTPEALEHYYSHRREERVKAYSA